MKLIRIFKLFVCFFLILLKARLLRSRGKKTKTKKNGAIFFMWAIGDKYKNKDVTHQFFDNGDIVSEITASNVVDDYRILRGEILDNEYLVGNENIAHLLNKTPDFTIRKVKIYKRSFIEPTYHEFLQMCVTNDYNDEFYFVIDRGANLNSLKQEKFIFQKAFRVLTTSEPLLQTRVRIVFTGYKENPSKTKNRNKKQQDVCADDSIEWAEFRGHRVDKDKPDSILISTSSDYKHFTVKKFNTVLKAILSYAIKYPGYDLAENNCQHFATGFYNSLTGEKKEISNPILAFKCSNHIDMDSIFQSVMMK